MEVQQMLAEIDIFSELPREDLERLTRLAVSRTFKAGENIVGEGEVGVGFYVIVSGRVAVVKQAGGPSEKVVNHLGPGNFFGEMTFFENYPRSATIRAEADTECLLLTKWDFQAELNRPGSRIAIAMLPVLARRIRQLDEDAAH